MEIIIVAVCCLYLGWFVYRLGIGKRKRAEEKALLQAALKKDPSEWTETDRKLLLKNLERYREFLNPLEYDILHAQYAGTTSTVELAIKAGLSPSQILKMGYPAPPSPQASSTKTIVKGAVAGGIIAGPAGAVVGAIVGKDKADRSSRS